MKRTSLYILIIFLSTLANTVFAENIDYGLFIKAFPFNDQEKTSLVLENNQPIKLKKEMTMTFDMNVRKDNVFGIVFRIITDRKDNIDLIFTVGENDKRYPMLVVKESVYMISEEVVCDKWLPVSITLSSEKNEISIVYDTTELSVPFELAHANNAMISFGLCPFQGFTLYDIASVNIRDINISHGKNPFRLWKLENHDGEQTIDQIAQIPAITTNPRWISDIYASWDKIYSKQIKENSLFAFDPNKNVIYIVSPDSKEVISFDTETKKEEIIAVRDGLVAANAPNQIFYDSRKDRLSSYNLDENIVSHFSFSSHSWSNKTKSILEHGYWNNTVSYSPLDSTLISFGGYGFYKYNNDLIRLSLDQKSIKKSNLPEIPPRYSVSSAIVNNTLYIFGGRGNKSGRQELSPRNYYDFYSVNLLSEQINKLWEINQDSISSEFLPGENLIFDDKEDCFYVFTSKDGGTLLRIRKDRAGYEQVSFSVNEDLTSHYLYTNLYFSPGQKKFYALMNKIKTDKSAEVAIYSLNYPPITINISSTSLQEADEDYDTSHWIIICGVLGLIAALLILYYLVRKKFENRRSGNRQENGIKEVKNISSDIEEKADGKLMEQEQVYYDFSKQSICFLGGFNVMDKNGENITGLFTPMLKYLLVLLVLTTVKDSKGISGRKLIQLLWYDKNEESAKNNRNVYLSKLRSVLENVGSAEIINQNGFWTIKFGEDIICDYTEAVQLFTAIKDRDTQDQTDLDKLLELLLRGVLLPNTEADWVDGFKSDFSNLTIDILTELSQSDYYKLTDDLKLKIADTLFLHDYINEVALYLKCSIYFNSGKKGIAKTVYDNFNKEYSNLLGTKYKYSLTDVVEGKNIEH
ncbi:hypothetical protein [Prevotella sp. 10(H)]|uniref:hypothetical protein n=1 Tax=Prevotella sp. 10(H) TaxID=1158294 RepID=UPI0004A753D1|nr:hypothetical protein [Prevotella sp. 10(H)]